MSAGAGRRDTGHRQKQHGGCDECGKNLTREITTYSYINNNDIKVEVCEECATKIGIKS